MRRLIYAAAVGLMLTGGAFAQAQAPAEGAPAGDPAGADKLKSASDPKVMAGFYSDTTMSTLRSPEEIKAAWDRLNIEDQTAVKAQCGAPDATQQTKDVCAALPM